MSQSSICDCSNLTALPRGAFGSGLLRVQTRGVQAPGASRAILSCTFVHSRVVGYCRSPQHLSRSCGHNEGARVLGTIDSAQTAPLRSWTTSFRQDTPSRAEQDREQSGSTATAGSGQMQQAGPSEAAAGERCPICLGTTRNTAYTYTCFHAFCFRCIRRWAANSSACPLCRQPIDRILHTVRADDDYQQYVCRPSAHGRRNAARERVRSRSPQRRYNLRPRPTNNGPAAGRRGPQGITQADGSGAAPEPINAAPQQAAGQSPTRPTNSPVLRVTLMQLQTLHIQLPG
eukprot:XP_027302674.1 E3 ubiquitin-protein ligase Topors-like [Anas platyrhynchos]